MKTDAEYLAWLQSSDAFRVSLFEFSLQTSAGVPLKRYVSNRHYDGYLPIVEASIKVTASISYDSDAKLSAGAVKLYNFNGVNSNWFLDVWANGIVEVYVGDARWARSDFRRVFKGVIDDIDGTQAVDRMAIKIRDQMELLNTVITDEKMTTSPTPDTLRPKLLGECHNLTPKLKNKVTGEYEFNGGDSEEMIEARADGKPRDVTKNLSVGSFTFNAAVGPGTVTCSAQGVKYNGVYVNTIGKLIQYLATQCGRASTRFTTDDLDMDNFNAFESTHTQPVGWFYADQDNVITAIGALAKSVGAQVLPSMLGKLRIIQYTIPTTASYDLTESLQVDGTIKIKAHSTVAAAVKIGYCRNWTVQDNLQTSIPDDHKALYALEWLTTTAVNTQVQTLYKRDAEPDMRETALLRKVDADAEAARCLAVVSAPRTTYALEGTPPTSLLDLGKAVTLYSKEYAQLKTGKVGFVTSIAIDYETLHTDLEVTV